VRLGLRDVARRCAVASQPDVPSGTTRGIEADEETEKPDHRTSAPVELIKSKCMSNTFGPVIRLIFLTVSWVCPCR